MQRINPVSTHLSVVAEGSATLLLSSTGSPEASKYDITHTTRASANFTSAPFLLLPVLWKKGRTIKKSYARAKRIYAQLSINEIIESLELFI